MAAAQPFQLMSAARAERSLNRIASQVLEDTQGRSNIILFGIDSRGEKLASILSSCLKKIIGRPVPFYKITVKQPEKAPSVPDVDITGFHVIIIDDVIFSGKTLYRAFEMVMGMGDPVLVKLAVLVDRGHRIYPIEAQYIGITCPTKPDEHVHCAFDEGKPAGAWLSVNDA